MSDRTFVDLVPAYVLDALDADERADFDQALAADPTLQAAVSEYEKVVAGLATAVPQHAPPPALRDKILERARAERPLRVVDGGDQASAPAPPAPPASGSASPSGGGLAGIAWLAAAAGLAGALGLGVAYQGQRSTNTELSGEIQSLAEDIEDLQQRLADADSLLETFVGSDVRYATLSATDQAPSARLYWNTTTRRVVIAANSLPPAPEGRIYQLWGIADGENPVSLGTFQTGPDGTAIIARAVPDGIDFQLGAVTEEPEGGSPQPTSAPFLVGEWSQ